MGNRIQSKLTYVLLVSPPGDTSYLILGMTQILSDNHTAVFPNLAHSGSLPNNGTYFYHCCYHIM